VVLKPDDISRRSFSPSAEGFHQGEVRDFLARVAANQRTLLAALPEGQREVNELTLAIGNHEQRLHYLEQRLQAAIDRIERVADIIEATTHTQPAPRPPAAAAPPPAVPRASSIAQTPAPTTPTATPPPAPAPPPAQAPPPAPAPTVTTPAPSLAQRVAPPADTSRDAPARGASPASGGGLHFDNLENEPLISEKSNELLDGVLDDVMGPLSEGNS